MKIDLRSITIMALVASSGAAFAQDDSNLTAEQLAAKFMAQQATRGLVIAPSGDAHDRQPTAALPCPPTPPMSRWTPAQQVNFQIKFAFDSAALGRG